MTNIEDNYSCGDEPHLTVKSITSGNDLQACLVKISILRRVFGFPEFKLKVLVEGLNGKTISTGWYHEYEINWGIK